jgi:hypothetical protein
MVRKYGGDFVCATCIDEESIQNFINYNAESKVCSFCHKRSRKPIAAPLNDVAEFIERGLSYYYEDPANSLPYESREGGYQGTTFGTSELLTSEVGVDFPNDDGTLLQALSSRIEPEIWSERHPFSLSPAQRLSFSWEHFCEQIKHQRRYFFLDQQREDRELFNAGEILGRIFSFAADAGLFVTLPTDSLLFRARWQPMGKNYRLITELGPPPLDKAIQPNRMSPPGIVMMYASEQKATALAETANEPGNYSVGRFVIKRAALILDLTDLPRIPGIFEELPDSLEYDPRPRWAFLHEVARDISRPIARDDRVHIEYVPTQVVTEYLRTVTMIDNRKIDGIRYRSSRRHSGTSLVLFVDQDNLILPEAERPPMYEFSQDRWIQLDGRTVSRVTLQMIDAWS